MTDVQKSDLDFDIPLARYNIEALKGVVKGSRLRISALENEVGALKRYIKDQDRDPDHKRDGGHDSPVVTCVSCGNPVDEFSPSMCPMCSEGPFCYECIDAKGIG